MNWEKQSEEDLKYYYSRIESLENIRNRLQSLKETRQSLKSASADKVPVMGGTSGQEDKLINNIVESERLKLTYSATKRLVEISNKGLDNLTKDERTVLDGFYMRRTSRYIEDLCDRLNAERATIYRIKDRAIKKFTINMYGIREY